MFGFKPKQAPAPVPPLKLHVAAPKLVGKKWLNSEPIPQKQMDNGVLLVHFWTYGSMNCQRVLPHLRLLWEAYGDKGLTMVGVHSPEYDYGHELEDVREAADRLRVTWPILLDNDFKNWDNFHQKYWPALYLIKNGKLIYKYLGEGNYHETDHEVKRALGLLNK